MGRPALPQHERSDAQMGIRLTREERRQLNALQKLLGMSSAAQVVKLAIAELYASAQDGVPAHLRPPVQLTMPSGQVDALTDALDRVADECALLRRKIVEGHEPSG